MTARLYCATCRAVTPHRYVGRVAHGQTRLVDVYRCACDTRRPGPFKETS